MELHGISDWNFVKPCIDWFNVVGCSFGCVNLFFFSIHGNFHGVLFDKLFISLIFQYREREVIRHCLKHFRQMRYTNALEALAKETQVQLEDPHLTKLHEILVEQGDFQGTEDFMSEAVSC